MKLPSSADDLGAGYRSSSSSSIRFVLFVDGVLLLILSAAMAVPLLLDFATANDDWTSFALSAGVSAYAGAMLTLANRGYAGRIDRRTGYMLTVSAWLTVGTFGALPFLFSSLDMSITDAFFETMSGLTTTGSTVIVGLDGLPLGLLLWRSLLQWIGGAGIIVMAILLLPALGVGGMQLFRTESSDISDNLAARQYHMARLTVSAYVWLTIACAIAYGFAGMGAFDAVNHAMTTLATGGYSTKDASIGYFNSVPIEIVGIVFMIAGALPLILYTRLLSQKARAFLQEPQVPVFLAIFAAAVVMITLWNVDVNGMAVGTALRASAFNVASILTDTGYATTDYSAWGSFAVGLFFMLMLIGGCAGSTAGAIKVFRWQILFGGAVRQLKSMLSPHRVLSPRYGQRPINASMVESVRNFFFLYIVTFLVLSLGVMATGLDFLSSTSAVAQAMANAGPGLGPVVGPAANFASVEDPAKWLLVFGMLLGRLELSTVYVLLLVGWQRA
ncbi:MAG: TrkH family potassium uptake protein [Bauldia sp.]|nr:MAG: TrkH family potassium uptake protein [Bauldia sp.]MBZ0229500.1 TrkH family potassium uptake protein [Bauldia sp.]